MNQELGEDMLRLIHQGMTEDNLKATIYYNNQCSNYLTSLVNSNSIITNYYYFFKYEDDKLIGFSEWRKLKNSLFLNNIYVDEKQQGKGIGKLLFEKGVSLCNKLGINNITLDVFLNSTKAHKWYQNMGFKEISQAYYYKIPMPNNITDEKNVHEDIFISNYPQAALLEKEFGFTIIQLGNESIGILNPYYFRINNLKILSNKAIMQKLSLFNSHRDLLFISEEKRLQGGAILKTKSYRLKLIL